VSIRINHLSKAILVASMSTCLVCTGCSYVLRTDDFAASDSNAIITIRKAMYEGRQSNLVGLEAITFSVNSGASQRRQFTLPAFQLTGADSAWSSDGRWLAVPAADGSLQIFGHLWGERPVYSMTVIHDASGAMWSDGQPAFVTASPTNFKRRAIVLSPEGVPKSYDRLDDNNQIIYVHAKAAMAVVFLDRKRDAGRGIGVWDLSGQKVSGLWDAADWANVLSNENGVTVVAYRWLPRLSGEQDGRKEYRVFCIRRNERGDLESERIELSSDAQVNELYQNQDDEWRIQMNGTSLVAEPKVQGFGHRTLSIATGAPLLNDDKTNPIQVQWLTDSGIVIVGWQSFLRPVSEYFFFDGRSFRRIDHPEFIRQYPYSQSLRWYDRSTNLK
jgi:hypothetical protein